MANYVVSDSGLSAVADAIRVKGGTSVPMSFPAGFVSAVEAISTGGAYTNGVVGSVYSNAFYSCSILTSVEFTLCTNIGAAAFCSCVNLTSASFPECITIETNAFRACSSLVSISFPRCQNIGSGAFRACDGLTSVLLPVCANIENSAFRSCYMLTSLYLPGSSLCALGHSSAFQSTPIGGFSSYAGQFGSIYVPASLLSAYQTASNWSYFSGRFVGLTNEEILALEG